MIGPSSAYKASLSDHASGQGRLLHELLIVRGEQLPDFLRRQVRTDGPPLNVSHAGLLRSDMRLITVSPAATCDPPGAAWRLDQKENRAKN